MGVATVKLLLSQCTKNNNHSSSLTMPKEIIPASIISSGRKPNEQLVTEVIQVVTKSIGEARNLSETDQQKIANHLHAQKQQFIKILTANEPSKTITHYSRLPAELRLIEHRSPQGVIGAIKSENRLKGAILQQQAINQIMDKVAIAYSDNLGITEQKLLNNVHSVANCNHPDRATRIDARLKLVDLANIDYHIFGTEIRQVALNLIARYFRKHKLIDIDYDKRLAETMAKFLVADPYCWERESFKQHLFDYVKNNNIDPPNTIGCFARLERKLNGQLSAEEEKHNKDYTLTTRWGGGKILPYPDHSREIKNERYNKALSHVAHLCADGLFGEAEEIAKRFKLIEKKPLMASVINYYKQKLCNQFGILKELAHLSAWKKLSQTQKHAVASDTNLQNQINTKLRIEAAQLQDDILQLAADRLKVAYELEREVALKEENEQTSQLDSLCSSYIADRLKALEQSYDTNFQRSLHYTSWSDVPCEFRQQFSLDNIETSINGTAIQHALQREFHDIAKETAQVWKTYGNNTYVQDLVKKNVTCIKKGIEQNQKSNITEAAQFADIAWVVLDHALAVGEGIAQGAKNVVYTFFHPIETAKNIGQLAYTITNLIGHATLEAIDICILSVINQDAAQKKLKNWEQKFTELIKRAYEHYQEIPNRNISKFISTVVTETFLTGKVLHWLKIFLSSARAQAAKIITQAQNITEVFPIAATSEGITSHINQAIEQPKGPSMKGSTAKKTVSEQAKTAVKTAVTKSELIETFNIAHYDAAIGDLKKLEIAVEKLYSVKGALEKNGPLRNVLECGKKGCDLKGTLSTARGAMYELEKALELIKKEETVLAFGDHLKFETASREFDIITNKRLIECKNINWKTISPEELGRRKGQFGSQLKIAKGLGKMFEVHSKCPIPDELKQWFIKKGIRFIEG